MDEFVQFGKRIEKNLPMPGGYRSLLVYRLASTIFRFNAIFAASFLPQPHHRRTVEQMHQAARSGKQNIVEGSLEKSTASNMHLTSVSRASFGELLEDYEDFLRLNNLPVWGKNDPRVLKVRNFREATDRETTLEELCAATGIGRNNPEQFANLMRCLIFKETYLLDQLLRAQERSFVTGGGFRENLFKKRAEFKKGKLV